MLHMGAAQKLLITCRVSTVPILITNSTCGKLADHSQGQQVSASIHRHSQQLLQTGRVTQQYLLTRGRKQACTLCESAADRTLPSFFGSASWCMNSEYISLLLPCEVMISSRSAMDGIQNGSCLIVSIVHSAVSAMQQCHIHNQGLA